MPFIEADRDINKKKLIKKFSALSSSYKSWKQVVSFIFSREIQFKSVHRKYYSAFTLLIFFQQNLVSAAFGTLRNGTKRKGTREGVHHKKLKFKAIQLLFISLIFNYFDKMINIDFIIHVLHRVFGNRKKDIRQDIATRELVEM